MNRNYIDKHLAVDRYVAGTLSDEEIAEFEERLVWDQALMDEVDLAEQLRSGLRAALAKNEVASASGAGIGDRLSSFFQVPTYAAAASFLVAVGLTSVAMLAYQPTNDLSPADGHLPTEIVALYATRSSEAVQINVAGNAWTVLLVDAPSSYTRFRASVHRRDDDEAEIWSQNDMLPTYPDSLAIGMPGSALAAGAYILTLDGIAAGGEAYERIQQIAFDVARPDAPSP